MKWGLILILLLGCNVTKRSAPSTIVLDGSKSYITGGDGKGTLSFYWQQKAGQPINIGNPNAISIVVPLTISGSVWQLKVKDNFGNTDSTIYTVTNINK